MHPHENPDTFTLAAPAALPHFSNAALDALLALVADTHQRRESRLAEQQVAA